MPLTYFFKAFNLESQNSHTFNSLLMDKRFSIEPLAMCTIWQRLVVMNPQRTTGYQQGTNLGKVPVVFLIAVNNDARRSDVSTNICCYKYANDLTVMETYDVRMIRRS